MPGGDKLGGFFLSAVITGGDAPSGGKLPSDLLGTDCFVTITGLFGGIGGGRPRPRTAPFLGGGCIGLLCAGTGWNGEPFAGNWAGAIGRTIGTDDAGACIRTAFA